jgi:hypothetical protein
MAGHFRTHYPIAVETPTETKKFRTQKDVAKWFGIKGYTQLVLEAKCKRLNYKISYYNTN